MLVVGASAAAQHAVSDEDVPGKLEDTLAQPCTQGGTATAAVVTPQQQGHTAGTLRTPQALRTLRSAAHSQSFTLNRVVMPLDLRGTPWWKVQNMVVVPCTSTAATAVRAPALARGMQRHLLANSVLLHGTCLNHLTASEQPQGQVPLEPGIQPDGRGGEGRGRRWGLCPSHCCPPWGHLWGQCCAVRGTG